MSKIKEALNDYQELVCNLCDEYGQKTCDSPEPFCDNAQVKLITAAQFELIETQDKVWRYDQCSK